MQKAEGFTLLEVLVALAVVAIAMGALLSSGGNVARSGAQLDEKLFAHWVASNRLVALRAQPGLPKAGEQTGKTQMAGREWRWKQTVEATDDPQVFKVEVDVSNADEQQVTRLIGYIGDSGGLGL